MHPHSYGRDHHPTSDIYGFRQRLYANGTNRPNRTATIARKTAANSSTPLNQLLLSQNQNQNPQRWQNTLDGIQETSSTIPLTAAEVEAAMVAAAAVAEQQQQFTYGANFNTDFNSQYSNTPAAAADVPIITRNHNIATSPMMRMMEAREAASKRANRSSIPSKARRLSTLSNNSLKSFPARLFNKMRPGNAAARARKSNAGNAGGTGKPSVVYHDHLEYSMPPSDLIRLFGETSLPGVRDIALSRSFLRRIFWVCSFFFFGFLALRDISQLVSEYYTYPITVDVRLRDSRRLQFPAVTVCNLNIVRYSALCMTNVSAIKDSMIPRDLREKLCAIQPSAAAKDAKDAKDAKEFAAMAAAAAASVSAASSGAAGNGNGGNGNNGNNGGGSGNGNSAGGGGGNNGNNGKGNQDGGGNGSGGGGATVASVTTPHPQHMAGNSNTQTASKDSPGGGGSGSKGHGGHQNSKKKQQQQQHHHNNNHNHSNRKSSTSTTTSSRTRPSSSSTTTTTTTNSRGRNTNTTPTSRTRQQPSSSTSSTSSGAVSGANSAAGGAAGAANSSTGNNNSNSGQLGTTTASTTDGDSIQDDINSYGVMSKHKTGNETVLSNGTAVETSNSGNRTESDPNAINNSTETTMSSTTPTPTTSTTSTATTTSTTSTTTTTSTTSTTTTTTTTTLSPTTAMADIPNDISMPIPESSTNANKREKRKATTKAGNVADLLLAKLNNLTSSFATATGQNPNQGQPSSEMQSSSSSSTNSTNSNSQNVNNNNSISNSPNNSPPQVQQQQQQPPQQQQQQPQPNKQPSASGKGSSSATGSDGQSSTPIVPENDIELTEREEKELQENLTNWLAVIYNSNEKIAQELGHQFEDFILRCTIRSTNCTSEESFESFFTPTEGNCFTFKGQKLRKNYLDRIKDETSIAGVNYGLEFVLNLEISEYLTGTTQIGAIIMIQHPDEIGNSASEAIFVAPQQSTYIGLKMINITRLPKPYPEDCIDHWPSALIGRLTQNASYSQQACLKICLQRTIHTRCKCQSAMLPQLELNSTLKICDTRRRSTRKCVEEVMFQAEEKVSTCKCPPRCQVINYDKTVSMTRWPTREDKVTFDRGKANINFQNLAKVTVYFQTMTCQEVRQEKAYTTAKLFSSLGGILGMYIGFSFLSLFEILEVFVRRFWYFLTKKRSRFRAAVHTITATFALNAKRHNSMATTTSTKDFELEKEAAAAAAALNLNSLNLSSSNQNNSVVSQRLPMMTTGAITNRFPSRLNQTYHHGLV